MLTYFTVNLPYCPLSKYCMENFKETALASYYVYSYIVDNVLSINSSALLWTNLEVWHRIFAAF